MVESQRKPGSAEIGSAYRIGKRLYLAIDDYKLIWRDKVVMFDNQRKVLATVEQIQENWGCPIENYYEIRLPRPTKVSRTRADYHKPEVRVVLNWKGVGSDDHS